VRSVLALVALAATVPLESCGTRGDDSLGLGLLGDRTDLKAVRLIEDSPPDTSAAFQSASAPADLASAPTLLVTARPGYLSRALVRFPSTVLPPAGATVDSARIDWPWREGFGISPFSIEIHRVTQPWTEAAIAPDSFPAFDPVAAVTADIPFTDPQLDTLSLDLLSLVQAWAADTTTNLGIALLPAPGEDGELVLDARESGTSPRLTVYWTAGSQDSSASAAPAADVHVLASTSVFVPLTDEPRRLVVSRGLPSRSLLRFVWDDLGPRATIHRADLVLHLDPARTAAQAMVMSVRKVLAEPWDGFSTSTDPEVYAVTTVAAGADSVVFDLTELLNELPVADNHGFLVRANEERSDTDYVRFHAHDTEVSGKAPALRIWYTPGDEEDGS
jgi:hypothetical protein